jgi:hypothetical protein
MRVWLVDHRTGDDAGNIEPLLRELAKRPGSPLQLVGATSFQTDFPSAMRKLLPDLLDVILINERAWPENSGTEEVFDLGVGLAIVAAPERVERFRAHAERQPIWFVPPKPNLDSLWLALVGARAGKQCIAHWNVQVAHLQQRLNDRILIERAKGILVQRLGISEEDAYKRLRVLSRRQRRQIRDIAQSLLDTECLLVPETNGYLEHVVEKPDEAEAGVGVD